MKCQQIDNNTTNLNFRNGNQYIIIATPAEGWNKAAINIHNIYLISERFTIKR